MSPFGYNETVANEYFPLEKENAIENNFNWSDYESPKPNVEKIIPASRLPESIADIPDDILNWAIECEKTNKPYRIIKEELEFYRKHNLPIPRRHPDQRHLDRMKLRNPRKLYDRDCDKCGVSMKTTYNPEREEVVYCEECYDKEVY
jgi:CxxC-x17-CxxC domain-containing protein